MLTRRAVMCGITCTTIFPRVAFAQASGFSSLLDQVLLTDPNALTRSGGEREAAAITQLVSAGRGPRPRYPKPSRSISSDAERLITACEISNPKIYSKLYQRPVWPKGRSGVTIGVGYDVGYVDAETLASDWRGRIPDSMISALIPAVGVTGIRARSLARAIRPHVQVPWQTAQKQFQETTLPLYISQTLDKNYLPGSAKILSADCLGALVSLVFNRGPSFKLRSDRYREMRRIRLHVVRSEFDRIPAEFRSMKRLWNNDPQARGLVLRRELEARLFEQGLHSA